MNRIVIVPNATGQLLQIAWHLDELIVNINFEDIAGRIDPPAFGDLCQFDALDPLEVLCDLAEFEDVARGIDPIAAGNLCQFAWGNLLEQLSALVK